MRINEKKKSETKDSPLRINFVLEPRDQRFPESLYFSLRRAVGGNPGKEVEEIGLTPSRRRTVDVNKLFCYGSLIRKRRNINLREYIAKIYDLTQTAPLVENVRTRQLRFLGHVLRMPDDEPCKEYALYIPPHGKRKPGRQRTLFLRYIQHLLGDTDNMIGPSKLSELAQDRCGWRKLVVACSAADR